MHVVAVTESCLWENPTTGQRCSIYGVCPWENPVLVKVGWTTVMSNGTVGTGRKPFKTREEAVEFANEWNTRCNVTLVA